MSPTGNTGGASLVIASAEVRLSVAVAAPIDPTYPPTVLLTRVVVPGAVMLGAVPSDTTTIVNPVSVKPWSSSTIMTGVDPRMLTVSQAARRLNTHPNSVRPWRNSELLQGYRVGVRGDHRFNSDDVDTFMRSRKISEVQKESKKAK